MDRKQRQIPRCRFRACETISISQPCIMQRKPRRLPPRECRTTSRQSLKQPQDSMDSIELTKRLPPGSIDRSNQEEGHDIESLLISTASENTLWWKTAARQILDMYCEGGWLPTDIEVEIYNPHKMTWNESHVLGERNVVSTFNSLRPAIEG